MKLNKTQRVYVAILVMALGAFLVDQLFFGAATPEQAGAAEGPVLHHVSVPSESDAPAAPQNAQQALQLLVAMTGQRPDVATIRDAFRPAPSWIDELDPPKRVAEPTFDDAPRADVKAAPSQPDPDARFRAAHTLTSIMRTEDGGCALINGRVVQVGHQLGSYKLVELTEAVAVFEVDGRRVELKLRSNGAH